MTVETSISKSGPYAGAGTTGPFTVNFRFLDASHLQVIRTDGTGEHVLTLTTDYTVAGVGNPTGSVTLVAALPVGQTLTIIRNVPKTQEADYVQNSDFPAESHENALDKLTMIDQQTGERLDRAVVFPASDSSTAVAELPISSIRANNLLGFDADGKPVAIIPSAQSAVALQLLLAAPTGASLIGANETTLDQQLKNRLFRVCNTYAELRALDKAKYTRAQTLAKTTLGDGGYGEYYYDPADTTTADNDFSVIVGADGGRWKRFRLVWQTTTGGGDAPTFQFARNTTHSGGTPGVVCNALNVSATVAAGVTNYEWSFLAQMDNSAGAGENVAVYAQAIKRARGPTWAGCFEIQDKNGDDPAQGGTLGIELAVSANGADTSFQRIGLHVAMGKNNPGGTTCEWGTGVYTGAGADSRYARAFYNDGPVRLAAFFNAADSSNGALAGNATFLDTGKSTYGIDLSAATYTGVAMRLAAGQGIAFDTGGTPARIRKAGSNLAFENSPALFSGGRAVFNNGFGLPSSGNVAASATAGSSGATPAQVAGYLIFQLDGSNFKIPYYGP